MSRRLFGTTSTVGQRYTHVRRCSTRVPVRRAVHLVSAAEHLIRTLTLDGRRYTCVRCCTSRAQCCGHMTLSVALCLQHLAAQTSLRSRRSRWRLLFWEFSASSTPHRADLFADPAVRGGDFCFGSFLHLRHLAAQTSLQIPPFECKVRPLVRSHSTEMEALCVCFLRDAYRKLSGDNRHYPACLRSLTDCCGSQGALLTRTGAPIMCQAPSPTARSSLGHAHL